MNLNQGTLNRNIYTDIEDVSAHSVKYKNNSQSIMDNFYLNPTNKSQPDNGTQSNRILRMYEVPLQYSL